MADHRLSDCLTIARRFEFSNYCAPVHDPDAIGDQQDLVEILAYENNPSSLIACGAQVVVNR